MSKYIDYCVKCGASEIYDGEPDVVALYVPKGATAATLRGCTCHQCGYEYRLYAPLYNTSNAERVKGIIARVSKELAKADVAKC